MVYKVTITDNSNTPLRYLPDLPNFKNGTEYTFHPGVNIIVGENGCGKTTLLKLIESYLIVDKEECNKGIYSSNIRRLFNMKDELLDGTSVIADYKKNTFRLCHVAEKDNDNIMSSFRNFGTFFEQRHASTGEGVHIALESLFSYIFEGGASTSFDYSQFTTDYPAYIEYINSHKDTSIDEWTILMDEPDRNLDVDNITQIKGILSFHKPQTQLITVVHNPLLIYSLSNVKDINIIEMTKDYVQKVKTTIDNLLK